ncbi:MAG: hypothetical protein GXP55_16950 [Deltaproteobacteria bacterium]|nr:hypothetical protein [Deltaproteobacteria bacterium]
MNKKLYIGAAALAALGLLAWALWPPDASSHRAATPRDGLELAGSPSTHSATTSIPNQTGADAGEPTLGGPCASVLEGPGPGAVYHYAVQTPQASQELVVRFLERDSEQGVTLNRWQTELRIGDHPALTGQLLRHCDARGEAEFWGPLGIPGLAELSEPTWRWPAHLRLGEIFEGEVSLLVAGESPMATRRRHTVAARERVSVPAGDFDCWRVDMTEWLEGQATPAGSLWVAEGVGLVRSRRELRSETRTMELISVEEAS